jgi:transposase-like protein
MMNTEPFDILEYVLKNVPREDAMNYLKTAFFNLVMEEEACLQARARKYEHSDTRVAHRNGFKERTVLSKDGPLVLKKPQFREFSFQTTVFDRYDRVEKSVALGIAESYIPIRSIQLPGVSRGDLG